MNSRSRNSEAAATAAEQKQRLQRERERARDTQPTVRTKMWKQTKNISHEHSAIGGALSSAKNSNKRNNNRNRTRIRSVTWRVKRATARAAQQRRPRLCRFEPETSRHCNTQTPHTHLHTDAHWCCVHCSGFNARVAASTWQDWTAFSWWWPTKVAERERVARKRATSRAELSVAVAVSVKARSAVRVCARWVVSQLFPTIKK